MQHIRNDLERLFGSLADRLPNRVAIGDDESVVLTAESLPRASEFLHCDEIWMRNAGFHFYDNLPVDGVELCIDKRNCRTLGLLLLSVVSHPEPVTVDIELRHPASSVTHLRLRNERQGADPSIEGFYEWPAFFAYGPSEVSRCPWLDSLPPDPFDLPELQITTQDEMGPMPTKDFWADFAARDTVVMASTDRGAVRFAELLLNAGSEHNKTDEFQLEQVSGYRGVGPRSAELRIWLPGSIGYDPDDR